MNKTVLVFIFFFGFSFFARAELIEMRPPSTELLEEKPQDPGSKDFLNIRYQYSSSSTKVEVVDFYRLLLTQKGFKEQLVYPRRPDPEQIAFIFNKPTETILLTFTSIFETLPTTYYLTAIKQLKTK